MLRGLNPQQNYRLTFHDGSAADQTLAGRELMEKGILLKLPAPNTSEIVFVDAAPGRRDRTGE
jgi:hypothetical protein